MKLVPVNVDLIPLNKPLPFALRSASGVLLAKKGYVIGSLSELQHLVGLGVSLHIDESDHQREYVGKLHALLRKDVSLGVIADTHITAGDLAKVARDDRDDADWLDLLARANGLLRDPQRSSFQRLLVQLHRDISRYAQRNPDATLLALMHLSATELKSYSAMHAMLVCVIAELAARQVLNWPQEMVDTLGMVALTMNISMTSMQDDLAFQTTPLTATQRHLIEVHAAFSAEFLKDLGVEDEVWVEGVFHHLDKTPGPLEGRSPTLRIARLIQRANVFAAMLAPRASREPLQPGVAMQACYFDEKHEVDEAGAALIKVVGIYAPGSYVRLATQEVAVVVRRGANTTTPRVAVLVNRQGMATAEPMLRDTSQKEYRIVATVSHRDLKIQLNLERLLSMV
jgi:HD-GYP domain-containing protein (c-di-GMP phosphodiesterase class II)